jgi:hypothetical protein
MLLALIQGLIQTPRGLRHQWPEPTQDVPLDTRYQALFHILLWSDDPDLTRGRLNGRPHQCLGPVQK